MYIRSNFGPLAQLVEQFPFKEWVDGSSPSRLTTNYEIGGYSSVTSLIHIEMSLIRFVEDG